MNQKKTFIKMRNTKASIKERAKNLKRGNMVRERGRNK